jgi:hypothetical protein
MTIQRLDETLRPPIVTDDLAYCLDAVLDRGVAHGVCGPHLVAQLLLWNHAVSVCQEVGEYLEHFGPQPVVPVGPVQEVAMRVEPAIRKDIKHGLVPSTV